MIPYLVKGPLLCSAWCMAQYIFLLSIAKDQLHKVLLWDTREMHMDVLP